MNFKLISEFHKIAAREDREKMTKNQIMVDKLRAGYPDNSITGRLEEDKKIHQVQRRIESFNSRIGKY